jgi:YggT family protein
VNPETGRLATPAMLAPRTEEAYLGPGHVTRTLMGPLINTLLLVVQIAWFILIAHIIMSWLISFQVLNTRQPLVAQLWNGRNQLLEPIYRPIRRILPATGGLDFAPLVAIIILFLIRGYLIEFARSYP